MALIPQSLEDSPPNLGEHVKPWRKPSDLETNPQQPKNRLRTITRRRKPQTTPVWRSQAMASQRLVVSSISLHVGSHFQDFVFGETRIVRLVSNHPPQAEVLKWHGVDSWSWSKTVYLTDSAQVERTLRKVIKGKKVKTKSHKDLWKKNREQLQQKELNTIGSKKLKHIWPKKMNWSSTQRKPNGDWQTRKPTS